ncbi:DUF1993 domain-containing protein [Pseudoruegeria sp. SHC-113]|uniref:DUF1993 domain-containing protein n=1 Tax=Pseudoruegeria sp. SHC-113 TaxID=2855439 RepID=UPI0021BB6CAF|nr:DUF1993 domain-containing protein [Pseudoruegeria sp. SHC-113]MCT8161196.1 DUF1993 domain-containing protein [Pseudoruegeria sp. SHC-113]
MPADLYAASVPVYARFVARIPALLAYDGAPDALTFRLMPGMLSAGENLHTAQGYVPRALTPLTGTQAPDLPEGPHDAATLLHRSALLGDWLATLTPQDFVNAAQTRVTHRAGEADLTQSGDTFLLHYALPNFFFHLVAGYAGLRAAGVPLSKGDFDGFHSYPPGFAFQGTGI